MGGQASKSRKTDTQLTAQESLECSANSGVSVQKDIKYSKNANNKSIKGGGKNNVKIKKEKRSSKKKKKSIGERQASSDLIEDTTVCDAQHLAPGSPVYRKKSSCPSCEARDILLGKNRTRSGSERSLRFSDFNKVLRRTRVCEWELTPLEVPLDGVKEPVPDDVCYICGVYTGYHVRICRVCLKAYHDGCLLKIGHQITEQHRRLIACKQWSCHQCVALNHLLTQEEVRGALEDLEDLDISKDNIPETDYLNFCKQSLLREGKIFTAQKEASSLTRFRLHAKSGVISWTDFLNMESIRILSRRPKESLMHLLTQPEIAEARKTFKQLDQKGLGMVSKVELQKFLDSTKTRLSSYYPDDSMMYMDEDLHSPVTWGEFLRDRAIYFLGQRPNLTKLVDGNCSDDKENMTMSFDSIDDDEDYTACASDFDHLESSDHMHNCKTSELVSQDQVLPESSKDNRLITSSNKSMLDDIDVELKKCHTLQEMRASCFNAELSKDAKSGQEIQIEGKVESQNSKWDSFEPSPYNDNLHASIPWADLGDRSSQKSQDEKKLHRKSEVITRKHEKSNQARAVSQVACKAGKNVMAPAYGNLVGRVHNGEWGF